MRHVIERDELDDCLYVDRADPGFTLPANIGDLGPAITVLNLSDCNLIGASIVPWRDLLSVERVFDSTYWSIECTAHTVLVEICRAMLIPGGVPESLGQLTNLQRLNLSNNKLTGKTTRWAAA